MRFHQRAPKCTYCIRLPPITATTLHATLRYAARTTVCFGFARVLTTNAVKEQLWTQQVGCCQVLKIAPGFEFSAAQSTTEQRSSGYTHIAHHEPRWDGSDRSTGGRAGHPGSCEGNGAEAGEAGVEIYTKRVTVVMCKVRNLGTAKSSLTLPDSGPSLLCPGLEHALPRCLIHIK